jgi:hypothetical protein
VKEGEHEENEVRGTCTEHANISISVIFPWRWGEQLVSVQLNPFHV